MLSKFVSIWALIVVVAFDALMVTHALAHAEQHVDALGMAFGIFLTLLLLTINGMVVFFSIGLWRDW